MNDEHPKSEVRPSNEHVKRVIAAARRAIDGKRLSVGSPLHLLEMFIKIVEERPAVETSRYNIDDLESALRGLYWDNVDYLTRNNLGGMNNYWMVAAREALYIPSPEEPTPGQALIVSAEEAKQPLAFRHRSEDPKVPYAGCHCDTCQNLSALCACCGMTLKACREIHAQKAKERRPHKELRVAGCGCDGCLAI
jgi:hypothetical protein